jgi:circadian clock protein KaiB
MVPVHETAADTDAAGDDTAVPRLILELYVAGTMPRSVQAITEVKRICNRFFKGHYALKVFDLTRDPHLASVKQILALPTLIKVGPSPSRRLIGDFADAERVAAALGLRTSPKAV